MKDITSHRLMLIKGVLFVLSGLLAAGLLVVQMPTLKTAFLLAVAVWCFARAYYFAFYVIERYIDPGYRFSGLWSMAVFLVKRRGGQRP